MSKYIYQLWHVREDADDRDQKLLGYFADIESLSHCVDIRSKEEGFSSYVNGFSIQLFRLNAFSFQGTQIIKNEEPCYENIYVIISVTTDDQDEDDYLGDNPVLGVYSNESLAIQCAKNLNEAGELHDILEYKIGQCFFEGGFF